MAKLWIWSDLHLDVGYRNKKVPFRFEAIPECDVIVVPGDVCENMEVGVEWIDTCRREFGRPIIYVGGNHEFYRTTRDGSLMKARGRAANMLCSSHHRSGCNLVHVLQDGVSVVAGVRFLGCTLWTDYRLDGEAWQVPAMLNAEKMMTDHEAIRYAAGGYRPWLPKDCLIEHENSINWLKLCLEKPFDGPTVVVTHHAPSSKSIHPQFRGSLLNGAYASNLDHLVDRATLWVHGHVHHRFDYEIGDGRVVCNPRGYPDEQTGFDPALVIEV